MDCEPNNNGGAVTIGTSAAFWDTVRSKRILESENSKQRSHNCCSTSTCSTSSDTKFKIVKII